MNSTQSGSFFSYQLIQFIQRHTVLLTATYSIIDCLITKRKTNAKLIFASRQRAAELQIKPSLCAVRWKFDCFFQCLIFTPLVQFRGANSFYEFFLMHFALFWKAGKCILRWNFITQITERMMLDALRSKINFTITERFLALRESYGRLEYRPWKNLCRFVKCRIVYKFSLISCYQRKEQTS